MNVISKKKLRDFWKRHANAEMPLRSWYSIMRKAKYQNLAELKADFPSADLVGECTVFNIGGNNYRLIAKVYYRVQRCYVRVILTHRDYDKGDWKDDCHC